MPSRSGEQGERSSWRVLLLGGYGRAGLEIADTALLHFEGVHVRLAGRNPIKLQRAVEWLRGRHPARHVTGVELDASDTAAVQRALGDCKTLILCLPLNAEAVRKLLQGAVEAGVDTIDLGSTGTQGPAWDELSQRLRVEGRVVLGDAGINPGCASMLARYAGQALDRVHAVTIRARYSDPAIPEGGVHDIIAHGARPALLFSRGRWRERTPFDTRTLDFGPRFGRRVAVPVSLPELTSLPQELRAQHLILYQAGFDPASNAVLLLSRALRAGRHPSLLRGAVHAFRWSNARFARPPFGLALQMRAIGDEGGRRVALEVSLTHEDLYRATAIPVVAALHGLRAGGLRGPGAWFMGHAVEPDTFLDEMAGLGMGVEKRIEHLDA